MLRRDPSPLSVLVRLLGAGVVVLAVLAGLATPAHAVQYFGFSTSANRNDLDNTPAPGVVAKLGKQGGAEVMRMDISWKAVQRHGPGDARWGQYDHSIAAMRERGIKPLIMIANAPDWAAHPSCANEAHCPPAADHLPDWATFARRVANRYPGAAAIEVWNAPNTFAWWPISGSGPDAAHYARVWNWAATAIHRADANTPVLFGSLGIAGGNENPNSDTAIPNYLPVFYRNLDRRALRSFDGLSIHPYPSLAELDEFSGRFLTTIRQARAVRNQHDPGRKLWVTETGMTTTGSFGVSERNQARVDVRAMDYLAAQPDVAATIIYTLIEAKWNSQAPYEKGYGIVAREGGTLTPKQAFCAFARRAGTPRSETGCPKAGGSGGGGSGGGGGGGGGLPARCTVTGTTGKDRLVGTPGNDVICAGGGRDKVVSGAGNDVILGGGGGDVVNAGKGSDLLRGARGRDRLRGGRSQDVLAGGKGRDTLVGGPGKDRMRGGPGKDRLRRG